MSDAKQPLAARSKGLVGLMLVLLVALVVTRLSDGPELPPDIPDEELVEMRPSVEPSEGYAGSDSCRECHEHEHRTWHHSWHRTMTQEALPENILGDFDDVEITNHVGQSVELFKRDGRAWFRMDYDPRLFIGRSPSRREYPIELITGSHHMQIYWFPAGRARTLGMMPVVWLKEDRRWVPRQSVFLIPSGGEFDCEVGRWNETCLKCHTTNPEQRREVGGRQSAFDSHVSELGISCESCHGPGATHVAIHASNNSKEVSSLVDRIVNPDALSHEISSQVCGGCHSVSHVKDRKTEWRDHKPGDVLAETRKLEQVDLVSNERRAGSEESDVSEENLPADNTFWRDGKVRVSGREYTAMLKTPCHTKGEMSCLSCHSMHQAENDKREPKEWANDQLHPFQNENGSCLSCHESTRYDTSSHTHHQMGSSGSTCINCHMPFTTYGLLTAMRSHSISSPTVKETTEVRRPNACNLCHLDQTLGWTGKHLNEWFDQPIPKLTAEDQEVAQGALMALKKDAGLRALAAWHMSWKPAVETSQGERWMQPYLSVLLKDPFPAVRYVAGKSLQSFRSHSGFEYDYVANRRHLEESALKAHSIWQVSKIGGVMSSVLLKGDGEVNERFHRLYAERDNRGVALFE